MKSKPNARKYFFAVALIALFSILIIGVSGQKQNPRQKTGRTLTDTVPKNKITKKIQNLDDVIDELDRAELELNMQKFQKELAESLKGLEKMKIELNDLDLSKLKMEIENSMKDFDSDKFKMELERSMKDLDLSKMKLDFENSMKDFDSDKFKMELEKSMKDLDLSKMKLDFENSMKDFDSDKFKMELEKSMKDLDLSKMKLDFENSMKDFDSDKFKMELEKSMKDLDLSKMKLELEDLKKIDMSKLQDEMKKLQEELKDLGPQMEKELANAKVEIEKAKKEMHEYKEFVDGLEKDGLINTKKDYSIEEKDGELIINGKKQPANVYNNYRSFLEKHKNFKIEKSEGNFNIHNKDDR